MKEKKGKEIFEELFKGRESLVLLCNSYWFLDPEDRKLITHQEDDFNKIVKWLWHQYLKIRSIIKIDNLLVNEAIQRILTEFYNVQFEKESKISEIRLDEYEPIILITYSFLNDPTKTQRTSTSVSINLWEHLAKNGNLAKTLEGIVVIGDFFRTFLEKCSEVYQRIKDEAKDWEIYHKFLEEHLEKGLKGRNK